MAARKLTPVKDSGVTWQDPPPPNQGSGTHASKWDTVVAEIQAHPGQWALVGEQLSNGVAAYFRKRGFKVTTRNNHKPTPTTIVCDVYVMWEGNK